MITQYVVFLAVTLLSWVWLYQGIKDLGLVPKVKAVVRKQLGKRRQGGGGTSTGKQPSMSSVGDVGPAKVADSDSPKPGKVTPIRT